MEWFFHHHDTTKLQATNRESSEGENEGIFKQLGSLSLSKKEEIGSAQEKRGDNERYERQIGFATSFAAARLPIACMLVCMGSYIHGSAGRTNGSWVRRNCTPDGTTDHEINPNSIFSIETTLVKNEICLPFISLDGEQHDYVNSY
jgi:hypothetical protein